MDIVTADVQKPGDIIEGCEDKSVGFFCFHLLTDLCDLICSGLAGPSDIQFHDRLTGKNRTVFPDLADQVIVYRKCDMFFLQKFLQFFRFPRTYGTAVEAKTHAFF